MNAITLRPMTEEQFQIFAKSSTESYARTSPHYRNLPFEVAHEQVLKDFQTRMAPNGLETPGHYFLAILKDSAQIGYLHLSEFPKNAKSLFAWNFEIDLPHRGQGYGRLCMLEAKKYFKPLGFKKVTLNVYADNEAAIHLYEKFGFKVTQFNMECALD